MATTLPAADDFTNAATDEAGFKAAITGMRAYLAELFGADGVVATARNALGLSDAATTSVADIQAGVSTFEAGTAMLFFQNAAPMDWTLNTTHDDKLIRVVDNQDGGDDGGDSAGSWTISGVTVDGHTLVTAEIPAHTHNFTSQVNAAPGTGADGTGGNPTATSSTGGGGSHTHGVTSDGTWRPTYINVIVCIRDA